MHIFAILCIPCLKKKPEQLHKKRPIISHFGREDHIFVCLLIVGEKFDVVREPPAQFPWKQ